MSGPVTGTPQLTRPTGLTGRAVPMYVHPVLDPGGWRDLVAAPLGTGFVVVNAADGPGARPDSDYRPPVAALQATGQPVLGYVDLDYGRRPLAQVLADLAAWRDWYGIAGVFVDRTPSGVIRPQDADLVVATAGALRVAGAGRIVLNPGTPPVLHVAEAADAVVTFEGPWATYRGGVPAGPAMLPDRVVHLVHSVPAGVPSSDVVAVAERAGAGVVGISRLGMPNPWAAPASGPAS